MAARGSPDSSPDEMGMDIITSHREAHLTVQVLKQGGDLDTLEMGLQQQVGLSPMAARATTAKLYGDEGQVEYQRLLKLAALPETSYEGIGYYKRDGNQEEEQLDALKIAEAINNYGRAVPGPSDKAGWDLVSVYLYHAGIPRRIKQKILRDAEAHKHPSILMHYLDMAGYTPWPQEGRAHLRRDAILIAKLIADLYEGQQVEEFATLLGQYDVPEPVAFEVLEALCVGDEAPLQYQLKLALEEA